MPAIKNSRDMDNVSILVYVGVTVQCVHTSLPAI